jgi:serine/threonine protein kinase
MTSSFWRKHDDSKEMSQQMHSDLELNEAKKLAREWRDIGPISTLYKDVQFVGISGESTIYVGTSVGDNSSVFLRRLQWSPVFENTPAVFANDYVTGLLILAETVNKTLRCGVPNTSCYIEHFIATYEDGSRGPTVATMFVSGFSLGEYINRNLAEQLPPPIPLEFASMLESAARALSSLHARDVVLRDISTEDVLVVNAFTKFTPYCVFIGFGENICWDAETCRRNAVQENRRTRYIKRKYPLAPGDPALGVLFNNTSHFDVKKLKPADVYNLATLFVMAGNNVRVRYIEPRLNVKLYPQNDEIDALLRRMTDFNETSRPPASEVAIFLRTWLDTHGSPSRKRTDRELRSDLDKVKKRAQRVEMDAEKRKKEFTAAMEKLSSIKDVSDTLTLGGKPRLMMLKFEIDELVGHSMETGLTFPAYSVTARAFIEGIPDKSFFRIRIQINTETMVIDLDLFINRIRNNPDDFVNVDLGFDPKELSGVGRSLLCRTFREIQEIGVPVDTVIEAHAQPISAIQGASLDEDMDKLLTMYTTLSFRPVEPRVLIEKGQWHPAKFDTLIQTTLGALLAQCDKHPGSKLGTPFNREKKIE